MEKIQSIKSQLINYEARALRFLPYSTVAALNLDLKKGALHKNLDIPQDEKIPETKLDKALHSKNKLLRKRAQFAKNAKIWHHATVSDAYLRTAIKTPNKLYVGHQGELHDKLIVRHKGLSANLIDHGFLNHKNKFFSNADKKSLLYARDNDLIDPKYSKDAHKFTAATIDILKKRKFPKDRIIHTEKASLETAKTLANVFIQGETNEPIGTISMLRGKFVFTPNWDAPPNIPPRFAAPTAEEMKIALAEKGLHSETASTTISLDLPLMIRLLEWSREEAKNDVDLHYIAENLQKINHTLTMDDYPAIVGRDHSEPVKPTHEMSGAVGCERIIEIHHNGDFNWKGFLNHLYDLGQRGSSRSVIIDDEDGKPDRYGFDGDGADKILLAKINGEKVAGFSGYKPEKTATARFITEDELRAKAKEYKQKHNLKTYEDVVRHLQEQASLELAASDIRNHLEAKGWTQGKDKVWKHPTSKNQLYRTEPSTHKHHYTVTHKDGNVTRHKTNSDTVLRNHISELSKKPDNSGISNTLNANKGSLHEHFGLQKGQKIPMGHLLKLANSEHPLSGRARLVYNLNKARKRGPITYKAEKSGETK